MNLPIVRQAVGAIKNWASFGADPEESPGVIYKRKLALKFDDRYPKAQNPSKLTESQINELTIWIGLPNIGRSELALAISVVEAEDVNHVTLPSKLREVIEAWRAENPEDSDGAARAQLMGALPAVVEVNNKMESARLAQESAQQAGAELTKAWRQFEELPKRFEKVVSYLASVNAALVDLEAPRYDEQIRQLMRQIMRMRIENSHLEDGRAARLVGQLPELLLERDTVPFKRAVNLELKAEYEGEIERLKLENARLAKALGTEPHRLS
jgi:hypothetical protein